MKYNYTLDIGALILYSVIISLYIQRPHVKDKMHNIYIMLFTCAYISPVFDIISSITVNNNMHSALVITSTALYFLSLQGVTFCFTIYIVYQIEQFKKVSHVNRHLLAAPNFFMVMLIITNDLSQLIFKYSRNGGYSRGSLHFLCYIVPLMYFAWAVLYLFNHRKAYDRNFVITIENICIVNIIFIIIQFFFPYLLLISFGFAVSMVLLYLTARTKNASLDKDSGMLNREYFIDAGTKMIYSKVPFSLVLVKIQDYDSTSNLYGEEIASILMKKIASKLCSYVEIGEAFQLNIDSFAFIIKNKEEVSIIESEFRLKLSSEWTVLERKLSIPFLITNISFPEKIHSSEEFISLTSYFEKLVTAKTGIISCDELKYKDSVRESKIENAIRTGLEKNRFEIYYQPVCTAIEKEFMTAEALVRLKDPKLGEISPTEFIPIAERSGLMITLGNYILEEVCKFISTHNMEELGLKYIEVNLSVVQCMQRDFMEIIHSTINKYKIDKKYICFEITETASNYAPEVFSTNLSMLVDDGHELALDDFGTGYGNLQRMVTTNFAIVKIDKEMIQQTCNSTQLKNAFAKMVALFHSMNLRIVAEGVETEEQYNFLSKTGVDYIQGFYFSHAIPKDQFIQFLMDNKK